MLSMRSLVWVGHAVTYMLLCSAGGRVSVLVKPDDGLTWPATFSTTGCLGFSNTHGKRPLSLLSHNPADKLSPLTTLMSTRGGIRRGGERCGGLEQVETGQGCLLPQECRFADSSGRFPLGYMLGPAGPSIENSMDLSPVTKPSTGRGARMRHTAQRLGFWWHQ